MNLISLIPIGIFGYYLAKDGLAKSKYPDHEKIILQCYIGFGMAALAFNFF